jgi:penicillin amidase
MLEPPPADSLPPSASRPLRRGRNRRWPRILLWTFGSLLVLLLLAAVAGVLWLRAVAKAALPQLDGDIHLAGLSAPVIVRRDAHGVPHIDAATLDDLLVAQGYVTAQDRLWQMDGLRRGANGELAEILGPSLVQHDKTQRVLQIRLTAQRVYDRQSPAARRILDDYARGVNLYIAQCESSNTLPVEFRLLHYRPQPWRGVDSISVGLAMVQTLDLRIATKLSRARVAARLNDPKLEADLYPVGSWRDRPPTGIRVDLTEPQPAPPPAKNGEEEDEDENTETRALPRVSPVSRPGPPASPLLARWGGRPAVVRVSRPAPPAPVDTHALRTLLGQGDCPGCAVGSNNWVVAGTHTASGKPLLANDMHLTLREPDTWYIADLYARGDRGAPGFHAAGVTLPGMPLIIAGHNEHVAWGFTALYGDVQDLYIEKLDGKGNFESSGGPWYPHSDDPGIIHGNHAQWLPLGVDPEVIHVRGGKDVKLTVQSTAHGPLLNPLLNASDPPTALKWTLYDDSLNTLPIYEMNVASNWAEFSAALAQWCWPTQNLVYADDQGHIAYRAVGQIPIRPAGISDGPIRDLAHEWGPNECAGICPTYIPFDQMPNAFDPPSGFLATANARVTTDKSPYSLTNEWGDPYRVERIYKVLDGRDRLTAADMLAVETDIYSEVDQEMGHRFAYAIDHTPGPEGNGDARMRQAADLMRSWDGRLTNESPAASIVTQTRAALWSMILEPKLGKLDYHWSESTFAEEEIVMHAKPEWLPPGYKNWDELLTAAVRKGMKNGKAPADLAEWSYGSWHVVDIEHPLAGFLPLISRIAGTGPQPQSGDGTTVKQVGRTLGSSQRFTMDWSNIDGSTESIVLGESGNPLSPYFRDQWNDWYNGTTFALPFTPAAVAAQTRHTLRLLP